MAGAVDEEPTGAVNVESSSQNDVTSFYDGEPRDLQLRHSIYATGDIKEPSICNKPSDSTIWDSSAVSKYGVYTFIVPP